MIHRDDAAYYRARATTERRHAEISTDSKVARVHQALADAYAERAGDPSTSDAETGPIALRTISLVGAAGIGKNECGY